MARYGDIEYRDIRKLRYVQFKSPHFFSINLQELARDINDKLKKFVNNNLIDKAKGEINKNKFNDNDEKKNIYQTSSQI